MSESLRNQPPEPAATTPDEEERAINREIWEGGPVAPDEDLDTPDADEPGPRQ